MARVAKIVGSRLLSDLHELASIGRSGAGVRRVAYSESDVAARRWIAQKFAAAGLTPQIDRVGNVFGRWPGAARALLIGSHTDTVPSGGWLDGSLGVIYALEVARAMAEAGAEQPIGIDVVDFADEEGTFAGWFGSRTFCGDFNTALWNDVRDSEGRTLTDALTVFADRPQVRLNKAHTIGYLEAHIEQGPRLEALNRSIGIVSSIVGIRTGRAHFTGRADHAGTTPMAMRKDAGQLLFAFVNRLIARFSEKATRDTVWNFGNVVLTPGAANVVPSEADLSIQYRDAELRQLELFDNIVQEEAQLINAAESGRCSITMTMATKPILMDQTFQSCLRDAAAIIGHASVDLPSGAGHDAAALALHIPIGMLFVPSKGGRSHTPDEDTDEKDIVAGAEVLLAAAQRLVHAKR
jgi:N-carbamoyl-L-amino-acid hydrolase